VRVAHEDKRCGALTLCAAFDTRTGHVDAATAPRKRQVECITLVLDNLRLHTGARVRAWLAAHPRCVCHFPPVHWSWMNQVEQWFSMLHRKRLRIADFADGAHLAARLHTFVAQWNQHAHPFTWSSTSVTTVMAACEQPLQEAARAA